MKAIATIRLINKEKENERTYSVFYEIENLDDLKYARDKNEVQLILLTNLLSEINKRSFNKCKATIIVMSSSGIPHMRNALGKTYTFSYKEYEHKLSKYKKFIDYIKIINIRIKRMDAFDYTFKFLYNYGDRSLDNNDCIVQLYKKSDNGLEKMIDGSLKSEEIHDLIYNPRVGVNSPT